MNKCLSVSALGFVLCLQAAAQPAVATAPAEPADNPLLSASSLPFEYPPFDRIQPQHHLPAIERGMADMRAEMEAIATDPAPPSFANTIVAMQRAGRLLNRATAVFYGLDSADTSPPLQATARMLAPKLSAHRDAILMDARLFARIQTLYQTSATLGLDREGLRLLALVRQDFVRAGALLSDADKARLRVLNTTLSTLHTTFAQRALGERTAAAPVFHSADALRGLGDAGIAAAAAAASAAGQPGKFRLALRNTTGQPPLNMLQNQDARATLMAASQSRGMRGGAYDSRATVLAIARARAERAVLLGHPHHAAYRLETQTIGSVDAVNRLLAQLAGPAMASARRQAVQMQAHRMQAAGMQDMADADAERRTLQAGDWPYLAERLRAARYAFDETQLKPYFELGRVLQDGAFFAAGRLYGLRFSERFDLPVYEPSVRVFDVFDADGTPLAIFMADFYERPNKNGGVWASSYVWQDALQGTRPVTVTHLNVPKPADGQPALLTLDEVVQLFHEFGHSLHAMFQRVAYPRLASVPSDFGEYPSQVNEMWALWPEVLQNYARHHATGAPLPQALADGLLAARKFNQGYETGETLAAAVIDQAWHQATVADLTGLADDFDVRAFETAVLARAGLDFEPVPPRYRSTYFGHIFASGGYAAGYYSYFWSEVLDANSVDWLRSHGGLTRANGDRLRRTVLSRGGSEEPLQLFRDFTGHEPDIKALLLRRGLVADADSTPAGAP